MLRENWRDREFWAWWWETQWSPRLRSAAGIGAAVLLGALGVFSADRLTSAKARSPNTVAVLDSTTVRTITVRTNASGLPAPARVRVLTVRIVRNVPTTHAGVRTQTAVVTAKQPAAKASVVIRTVVEQQTVTRVSSRPVTRTITHSVTQVTPPVTVTAPPVTVTETLPQQTVTVTTTVKHGHQ